MIPALANVGTVGRFTHRMQVETTRQSLQAVIVLAHGGARLQPLRLGSRLARPNLDLDQFSCRCHAIVLLYDARRRRSWIGPPQRVPKRIQGSGPFEVDSWDNLLSSCCFW